MLAYLDALCSALLHRDADAIRQLLRHPLAAALPEQVHTEAQRILSGENRPFSAPLNTLRLYHQTAHLLGVSHDSASRIAGDTGTKAAPPGGRARQIELPLPARVA